MEGDFRDVDVAVVGGGVAGLQTALTLGRARRRVVVLDDGRPRNGPAVHVHNFLGHDGPRPADLLAVARSMLGAYDVELRDVRVTDVRREDATGRLLLRCAGETAWRARAMVLASGLVDELPDVPGVCVGWGREVVACPHCHGWEVRDDPLAVLGFRGEIARSVDKALLVSAWSEDVVLFTDGDDPQDDQLRQLSARGVTVRTGRVRRVLLPDDDRQEAQRSVELTDGTRVPCRVVFVVTRQRQQNDLASRLGCRPMNTAEPIGPVQTDSAGRTSVAGVWAAGTSAVPALLAIGAAGHASTVAVRLHADLIEQDLFAALAMDAPSPP